MKLLDGVTADAVCYQSIIGWPGYRVGDDGSVWSCRTFQGTVGIDWRRLSPRPDKDGYLSVTLQNCGRRQTTKVAHLVLEAFIGPRPPGAESCHWPDADPANNTASNLRWAAHSDNIQDKVRGGTVAKGVGHGMVKLTESQVREIRQLYKRGERGFGYKALGSQFGISGHQVQLIVNRVNWKHI